MKLELAKEQQLLMSDSYRLALAEICGQSNIALRYDLSKWQPEANES